MTEYYEAHREELIKLYFRYIQDDNSQVRRRATHHIKFLLKPDDIK